MHPLCKFPSPGWHCLRERESQPRTQLNWHGDAEKQSRITSEYTLLAPLRAHLERLIRERVGKDNVSSRA